MNAVFMEIIKKSEAFKLIKKDAEKNSFNHAYLILSSDKAALDMLILQVCLLIYCKSGGCMECAECLKVIKKSKPDIKEPNIDGGAIKVEEINAVIADTHLTSFEKGKKLYIIRNMENSSERVQNKLLKTLEEPNDDVHFIITTPSLQGILPTIVSRVKHINLGNFSHTDIEHALTKMDCADASTIAKCSGGSITSALRLSGGDEYFKKIDILLDIFLKLEKSEEIVKYIFNPIFEELDEAMDIIELIFHDLLIINNGIDTLTLKSREPILRRTAKKYNSASISVCLALINSVRQKLYSNCNKINIIDSFFLEVLEVRNRCK